MKGSATFSFIDHVERYEPGDAFYTPPGHTPAHTADSELLLFGPREELWATAETMQRTCSR